MYRFLAHFSLTWLEGKADVRSVSCVSSIGRRRGTEITNALWSGVAAQAVMRKPASHRLQGDGQVYVVLYLPVGLGIGLAGWVDGQAGRRGTSGARKGRTHLWMPSDGYWKSSSTHWSTNPALRLMTTAQRVCDVAIDVT